MPGCDDENEAPATESPDEAPVYLVIAVSRRFHHPLAEQIYAERIAPILAENGIVLTCDFAADDTGEVDYWINRMNVLLDLADVHILIDIDRSPSTFYELRASGLAVRWGPGPSMGWNLFLIPPLVERPLPVVVYSGNEPRAAAAVLPTAIGVSPWVSLRVDVEGNAFEDSLARLLQDRIDFLRASRAPRRADPIIYQYWAMKTEYAEALSDGMLLSELSNRLVSHALLASSHSEREALCSAFQEWKGYVLSFNRDLGEVVELHRTIFAPPFRMREALAKSRRIMEIEFVWTALKQEPEYTRAHASVRELFSHRLLRFGFDFLAVTALYRLWREQYAFGERPRPRRIAAFDRLQPSALPRPVRLALQVVANVFVFTGFWEIAMWGADRVGGQLAHIVAGMIVAAALPLGLILQRFAGRPPGRHFRWLLTENPALFRLMSIALLTAGFAMWMWFGLVALPALLGRFVFGGDTSIRIVFGAIFALMCRRLAIKAGRTAWLRLRKR